MSFIQRPEWVSDRLVAERGEYAQFQMYTRAGNDAVAQTLNQILRDAEHYGASREVTIKAVQQGIASLRKGYPEVYDTEPRGMILDVLDAFLDGQGFGITADGEVF